MESNQEDSFSANNYLPHINVGQGQRRGRNVYEGYQRGWGLQHGKLADRIRADRLFSEAAVLATRRSIVSWPKLMNLYLILRFFLSKIPQGDIVEFGSFRGGCVMFMGRICQELYPDIRIFALDTFEGMPSSDPSIDTFRKKSFSNVDYDEVHEAVRQAGLANVHLIKGMFSDTVPSVFTQVNGIALAHIDCDNYEPVCYAYNVVKPHLVSGAYIVFDDATESGCLGATEAVETLVINRDGRLSEQIYPHFVFRN